MMNDFDQYAQNYQAIVQDSFALGGIEPTLFSVTKALELKRLFPTTSGIKLLDVGCGIGGLHPFLSPYFHHITGIDVSVQSIERAKVNNPDNTYLEYEGQKLPFADQSFDVVIAVCVLHHVPVAQWSSFVAELTRVVSSGGKVIIIEHNPLNPMTLRTVSRCPLDENAVLLRVKRTRQLFTDAGIVSVQVRYFPFIPFNSSLARWIDRLLAWLPLGAQYIVSGQKL